MSRILKKDIEAAFNRACVAMGWSQDVVEVKPISRKGPTKWRIGAVQIDNNTYAGGRSVERICCAAGSTRMVSSKRMTPAEFMVWCEGVCVGAGKKSPNP